MPASSPDSPPRPGLGALLAVWTGIGLKSFGGGASMQLLIRRTFVEERGWIEDVELAHFWNLCLFAPGINLIALTVLIGRRLGGTRGIVASLGGMLLPAAAITCALTAGFEAVHRSTMVVAALRGVVPATAGIMAVVVVGFARSSLVPAWREGSRARVLSVALTAATVLGILVLKISVILVVVAVATAGGLLFASAQSLPTAVVPPPSSDDGIAP